MLTTFPEMFDAPLGSSIMGRARESGLVECLVHNIRDWTRDRHRTTDDYPFGGGVGMVMKPEPVCDAVRDLRSEGPRGVVILTTPHGEVLDHRVVQELARRRGSSFSAGTMRAWMSVLASWWWTGRSPSATMC